MPFIIKFLSVFLNFIFYKFLTENLNPDTFGKVIFYFSISFSISIFANLGSDTVVTKFRLKNKNQDFFSGEINLTQFYFFSLLLSLLSSPIISFLYGVRDLEIIFCIMITSIVITVTKIFASNFLSIKGYFSYYLFSVFGYLLCLSISSFIFKEIYSLFLCANILLVIIFLIYSNKFNHFLPNFNKLFKFNYKSFYKVISKCSPLVVVAFLAWTLDIVGQYWLINNYSSEVSGYFALLHKISSLVMIGLAAINIVAYESFNQVDNHEFNKKAWTIYFKKLKISVLFSIVAIFLILIFQNYIFQWFQIPFSKTTKYTLFILIIGHFIPVCFGPITIAMTQYGFEIKFTFIYFIAYIINLIFLNFYDYISLYLYLEPLVYAAFSFSISLFIINFSAFIILYQSYIVKK